MNIEISGNGEATIEITATRPYGSTNTPRDAALLAETLYWNLSPEGLARFMAYLTKKVMDAEVEKHVLEIVKEGEPAISIVYPSGDRSVMTEDEVIELIENKRNKEPDHEDETFDVLDDDDDEY